MDLNLRLISRELGHLLLLLSAIMASIGVFSLLDDLWQGLGVEPQFFGLVGAATVGAAAGGGLRWYGAGQRTAFGHREALLLVSLSWIVGAGLGAMPFYIWGQLQTVVPGKLHPFANFVDCYFETMSGFTTTGATVITNLSTLPRSLLLWRATTHWLGGLGIVVLFVAVLPALGVGARRIYRAEVPGPSPDGVRPRIQDTARILWVIYLGITAAEILALLLCGMNAFDAVCHTMATLATGGFSTYDSSIAAFPSSAVHLVIAVFMVLAGVNFALYHQVLVGKWRRAIQDREFLVYLGIIVVATIVVTGDLWLRPPPMAADEESRNQLLLLRDALFQVVSIQTTTGFCTADFDRWGFVAKATLLILMFVGASAGSTGGGIKVIRIIIVAKLLVAEVERVFRPRVVRPLKVGSAAIDADLRLSTLVYVMSVMLLFAMGTIALMLTDARNGIDITTAATATAATLNNIGPGLARVGATQNYAWFSDSGKVIMSVLMALGRLEVFTLLVLFQPRFWRSD
ncbi:MAG: TrkH family potassium uptake protein [Phycisphaerae bacterium]|nr:TrkH family potassium uptake protein [Phycisphaerae bacterium]